MLTVLNQKLFVLPIYCFSEMRTVPITKAMARPFPQDLVTFPRRVGINCTHYCRATQDSEAVLQAAYYALM